MPTVRAATWLHALLGVLLSVALGAGALVQPAGPSWLVGSGELESAPAAASACADRLQVARQPAPAPPLAGALPHPPATVVPQPAVGTLRHVPRNGYPRPGILDLGPVSARAPPRA
jgi:hypothetical protein